MPNVRRPRRADGGTLADALLQGSAADHHVLSVEPGCVAEAENDFTAGIGDVVQFASHVVYCTEDQPHVSLHVMRLGSMMGRCSVSYRMADLTAKDGIRYKAHQEQRLVFEEHEYDKEIRVEVIESDTWAATEEFTVELVAPENCVMGQYLSNCRVKIIDVDPFPSKKYEEELQKGEEGVEEISGVGLYFEYLKLVFKAEGMAKRTIIVLIFSQMENAYTYYTLWVNVYVVDQVFNSEGAQNMTDQQRKTQAAYIGICYILPMFVLHLWDWKATKLDLGGNACDFLRLNLFQKFLSYSEASRARVRASEMQVAITSDTVELAEAYVSTFKILTIFVKVVVLINFILAENPDALFCIIAMPICMAFWIWLRSSDVADAAEQVSVAKALLIETVNEACNKSRVITDFGQRPRMADIFRERNERMSEKSLKLENVLLHNHYFPKWLGPVFIGFYIWYAAGSVINHTLSIGTYMAMIRIFHELSENFSNCYGLIMRVANAQGPAKKLAVLFNHESEHTKSMEVIKMRDRRTREIFQSLVSSTPDKYGNAMENVLRAAKAEYSSQADEINIQLDNVSYGFKQSAEAGGKAITVLNRLKCVVPQGNLVALIGRHNIGKSVLLKLIGHAVFTELKEDTGFVYVPIHLRILHVAHDPMLLNLPVLENLMFGLPPDLDGKDKEREKKRVQNILKELDMTQTLDLLKEELKEDHTNGRHSLKRGSLHPEAGAGQSRRRASTLKSLGMQVAGGRRRGNTVHEEDEEMTEFEFSEESGAWLTMLTASEKSKIQLARALVANPEVLVLQRPFIHYNDNAGRNVMKALKRHVKDRGLAEIEQTWSRRRPRTCFFTPSLKEQAAQADVVWVLQKDAEKQSCKEVDKTMLESKWHELHLEDE